MRSLLLLPALTAAVLSLVPAHAATRQAATPAELRQQAEYLRKMGASTGPYFYRRTRAGNRVPWKRDYTEERWREVSGRVDSVMGRRAAGTFVSTEPSNTGIPLEDSIGAREQERRDAAAGVSTADALERMASNLEFVALWNRNHPDKKILPGNTPDGWSVNRAHDWQRAQQQQAVSDDKARSSWLYSTRKRFVPSSRHVPHDADTRRVNGFREIPARTIDRARAHFDGLIASWHAQPAAISDERIRPARLTTIPGARSLGQRPFDTVLLDRNGRVKRYQPDATVFTFRPGSVALPTSLRRLVAGDNMAGTTPPTGYRFVVRRGQLYVANGVAEDAEWFALGAAPRFLVRAIEAELAARPLATTGPPAHPGLVDAVLQHELVLDGRVEAAGEYTY